MSVITIPRILREKLGDEAVEAFAKVISEAGLDTRRDLATKEDLFKVETRLKENITKVKEDVSKTEGRLREDIAKVKEDVNKTEGRLREEIAKVKEDVNKTEGRLREEIAKVKEDSAKIREDVAKISGEMVLLKLMLGGMLAGMISLIVKTFFMH
ncbi:MAG: coiled-coil domain-containing protein [Candidatus Magnetobacterium sp. LHC-1]|nr:DUF1640 domain-containing protein [Nitrospirota bacterium]